MFKYVFWFLLFFNGGFLTGGATAPLAPPLATAMPYAYACVASEDRSVEMLRLILCLYMLVHNMLMSLVKKHVQSVSLCRKALWLQAREVLWSNCKQTQSSVQCRNMNYCFARYAATGTALGKGLVFYSRYVFLRTLCVVLRKFTKCSAMFYITNCCS